ncbi:unnamed protein product [Closterium sp. NIES-53]
MLPAMRHAVIRLATCPCARGHQTSCGWRWRMRCAAVRSGAPLMRRHSSPSPWRRACSGEGEQLGHGLWVTGYGTRDMGHGIWDTGYGTRDMGHGIWDMGHGIWDMGYEDSDSASV